jgi:hypothetical protein
MVPALEVADIFRRHGEAFRQARAGHLGGIERRVMGAIMACRTAVLGGHVEQCDDCGATRIAYNSCRNRHCPKCQGVPVGNLRPEILVMQPAQNWHRQRATDGLDSTWDWRVLVQR